MVRSYKDVIVVADIVTRRTSKALILVMYLNTKALLNNINKNKIKIK